MSTTIKIVSHWDSSRVLYEHETTAERQASGLAMRDALEAATSARAYLSGAYLSGANLSGANLRGANLRGAYLSGANLRGAYLSDANLSDANLSGANLSGAYMSGANLSDANLSGANLSGAYMSGANLRGAYLSDANLSDANLSGANLSGAYMSGANLRGAYLSGANGEKLAIMVNRPFMQIGPIGSRCATLTLWLTDAGPMVQAGCFFGSLDAFEDKCEQTHGDNDHGKEYGFAVLLMQAHAELWTPAKEQA